MLQVTRVCLGDGGRCVVAESHHYYATVADSIGSTVIESLHGQVFTITAPTNVYDGATGAYIFN